MPTIPLVSFLYPMVYGRIVSAMALTMHAPMCWYASMVYERPSRSP